MVGGFPGCCACAASGHVAATLPIRLINSRRLMAVSGTNAQDIRSIALGKGLHMSALGQKQTFCDAIAMSALPPKADICGVARDVRFWAKADITELGCNQRLEFTSLIAGFVAPLPSHGSPLSSSKPKQLG
jgi:hypothetical protein